MKKNYNKTKYSLQIITLVFGFVFFISSAQASEITPDNIIKYVNLAREAQGVEIVVPNAKLIQVAKDRLDDMIAKGYFAHTSPSGVEPWYWFQKEKYDYHFAGENLAINFSSAESEQAAWMKSPLHRKNILDSKYQEIGVAVGEQKVNGQTSILAVQEFGTTFIGVSQGKQNFSPLPKEDAIKNADKIIPQVLAVKNIAPEKNVSGWFEKNNPEILAQGFIVSSFILMFSMALMAVAFLAVAMDKIWMISKKRKQEDGMTS